MRKKRNDALLYCVLLCCILLGILPVRAQQTTAEVPAEVFTGQPDLEFVNTENGNTARILDAADLLDSREEQLLLTYMEKVLPYQNAAFISLPEDLELEALKAEDLTWKYFFDTWFPGYDFENTCALIISERIMQEKPSSAAMESVLAVNIYGINMAWRFYMILRSLIVEGGKYGGWTPAAQNRVTFPVCVFDQLADWFASGRSDSQYQEPDRTLYYLNPDTGYAVYKSGSAEVTCISSPVQDRIDAVKNLTMQGDVFLTELEEEEKETDREKETEQEHEERLEGMLDRLRSSTWKEDRIFFIMDDSMKTLRIAADGVFAEKVTQEQLNTQIVPEDIPYEEEYTSILLQECADMVMSLMEQPADSADGKNQSASSATEMVDSAANDPVKNKKEWINEKTGYRAQLTDTARLLTEEEEAQIFEQMKAVTEYGDAVLQTIADRHGSQSYIYDNKPENTECLFAVMNRNREDTALGVYGKTMSGIFTDYARKCMEQNTTSMLDEKEYGSWACETFSEAAALLRGESIPEPAEYFENEDTGYKAVIEDEAFLLSEEERREVLEKMKPVTVFGNAAMKTIERHSGKTAEYAEQNAGKLIGENGTLFLIDMDKRMIYVYSKGEVWKTVTNSYATSITDNVYTYATVRNYKECAVRVFEQITDLLEGRHVAQPMKVACSVLLGLISGLLLNYILVRRSRERKRKEADSQGYSIGEVINITDASVEVYRREYVSRGSGGSFGGGGGGGGSGGGGGHSF